MATLRAVCWPIGRSNYSPHLRLGCCGVCSRHGIHPTPSRVCSSVDFAEDSMRAADSCVSFFYSLIWRLSVRMHCHTRILFLFTYAKIEYVSVRTYLTKKLNTYATYPRALMNSLMTRLDSTQLASWELNWPVELSWRGNGTPFGIRAEWSKASRRGHSRLTRQTSAVYAIRWWWWWWWVESNQGAMNRA